MNTESVILKGSNEGIVVVLDAERSFDEIIESIIEKFTNALGFFTGTRLDIRFKGRVLDEDDKQQLSDVIINIIGSDVNIDFEDEEENKEYSTSEFDGTEQGFTKFYRGTVRSGQLIKSVGNLVIIGDVNPGAQLIADGNIIIMGSLRGIVHAGYNGNSAAIIVALNLYATQIRIADVISRCPDEYTEIKAVLPEIAYVKDAKIYIDSYLKKF